MTGGGGGIKRQPGPSAAVTLGLMVLILLLAFALTAPSMNHYLIWGDEGGSARLVGVFAPPISPVEIAMNVADYAYDQVPLYYLLTAGWANFAGFSPLSLRYLSLLSGMLLIAWLYRGAHDAFGRGVAVAAALLLSTSAFVLVYFHEMKMYTLMLLLSMAHVSLYLRLLKSRRAGRSMWIAFVATAAALLYTHNLSMFLLGALGLTHLIFQRRLPRFRAAIVAWSFAGLSFAPYLPGMLSGSFTRGSLAQSADLAEILRLLSHLMTNGQDWLWLPLGASLVYAMRGRRPPVVSRLLLFTLALGAGLFAAGLHFNLLQLTSMRYLLLLWLPLVMLIAWALISLPHARWLAMPFILVWCLAGIQQTASGAIMQHASYKLWAQRFPPLHRYAPLLAGKVNATDFLLGFTIDDEINLEIKKGSAGSIGDYYLQAIIGIDGTFLHASERKYRIKRDVGEIMRARAHLLLAHDPSDAPPNYAVARHFIAESFAPCPPIVDQPTINIVKYRHPAMPCDHLPLPAVEYENGIRLLDRAIAYDSDSATISALFWWEFPDDSMLDGFNISLQVFAADGEKAAQLDRHLDSALVPWGAIGLSTSGLPAGDYQLKLIVYDRVSGAKLGGGAAGDVAEKILPILSFTVEAA